MRAHWGRDGEAIRSIRETVFVKEQHVPPEVEMDGADNDGTHVLAFAGGSWPIATGRLLADGRLGRMAVLVPFRRQGVGTAILCALLTVARELGHQEVHLASQESAMPFYAKQGFVAFGDVFWEAGIRHKMMRRTLAGDCP